MKAFDKVLDSTPDVSVYLMQMWQPNVIYAATKLVPWQQRQHTSQEIAQHIQQRLSNLPGVRVAVMSESPFWTSLLPIPVWQGMSNLIS